MKKSYVYILANRPRGVMYIGITAYLARRIQEHIDGTHAQGFTRKHKVTQLVYYETYNSVGSAIRREKQLKNWHRRWKTELIEQHNPNWDDLSTQIIK